jgi:SPP1 family predicted phage head-tail adaptor
VRIGKYRHRVLVEEPITSQDDTGDEITTWQSHGRKWGSVSPLRGREQLQANQIESTMDTRICIRWSASVDAINAKWRLSHLSIVYNIVSIAHVDMARKEIEIMASSGINRG